MIASSSIDRTVELGSLGPVPRSVVETLFFHFATVFGFSGKTIHWIVF